MKKMRILSLALALLMSLSCIAYADSVSQIDTVLTVSGAKTAGDDVRLKITNDGGELAWIDSMQAGENGEYTFSADLPAEEASEVYFVLVNGEKISEVTVLSDSEVAALFASADSGNVTELVLTYGKRLGFDLAGGYKDADRSAVNSLFLQEDLSDAEKITAAFARSVAINKINNADRSSLLDILKANAEVLGVDYEEDIDFLSEAKKEAFVIEMLKNTYSDFESFKAACSDALEAAEDTDEPSDKKDPPKKGSSGGGSTGGGSGKVSVAVPGAGATQAAVGMPAAAEKSEKEIFSDLDSVSWAKPHIENLYEKGVISGRDDGSFAPNDSVKREEFVAMIVRMFNISGTGDSTFSDVKADGWYKDAVSAAVENGIINGISENSFGVGADITRQDCAVICRRVLSYLGVEETASEEGFADSDKIADYAKDAVLTMKKLGIINGMDNNCFNPNGACTRAMAAKIIDMLGGCVK